MTIVVPPCVCLCVCVCVVCFVLRGLCVVWRVCCVCCVGLWCCVCVPCTPLLLHGPRAAKCDWLLSLHPTWCTEPAASGLQLGGRCLICLLFLHDLVPSCWLGPVLATAGWRTRRLLCHVSRIAAPGVGTPPRRTLHAPRFYVCCRPPRFCFLFV